MEDRRNACEVAALMAEPGPERLELGLSLIKESKSAFAAQQEEIDARKKEVKRSIQSYEWKLRNNVGKRETAEKNIEKLKKEIKEHKTSKAAVEFPIADGILALLERLADEKAE